MWNRFLAFLLYDMYGPIPLPDMETLKNPVVDNILPRATEEEMRTYIETNLKEAAAILPYKYDASDYGRFTKGLANTLLLKFYMRIGDWNNAVVVGEELTTDKEYGYQVVEDYNSLFTLDTERNMEVIFAAQAIDGSMENNWIAHVLPADFPTQSGLSKWGGFKMAWPFMIRLRRATNGWREYMPNISVMMVRYIIVATTEIMALWESCIMGRFLQSMVWKV